jgi:hypothetical protein
MTITEIVSKYTDYDDKLNKELDGHPWDLKEDLEKYTKEIITKCAKEIFDCNWELHSSDDNIKWAIEKLIK